MGWVWTAVLNGALGASAYLVARFGMRMPAGLTRALAAAVLAWVWVTVGVEIFGGLGLLTRGPLLGWVGLGLLIGTGCLAFAPREPVPAPQLAAVWPWEETLALGVLLWVAAWFGAPTLLRPLKVVSDGPIYHLYFAARWWKAGHLGMVAAPFGESAATYFPAVGDLWFTWLMVGSGGDRLAKAGQVPFLAVAAWTAYAAARRLGAGRGAAAVASAWFVTSTPLILFSFEPNVDTVFVAGYLLAAYFFLLHALGDLGLSGLALGALAAGCALGTKAPAVVFVLPLLTLGGASLLAGRRGWRETAAGVLALLLLPLATSGFFFARNALLTGNPLYPLRVAAFGRVWLSGWYGPDAMRRSVYYIPVTDVRALIDTVLAVLDPRLAPVWLAALAGAWALGRNNRSGADRAVWVASALAVANVALYWLVVPYRTQQRFMFHALGLAAVPLARTFDLGRGVRAAGVALLAAHLVTRQTWPFPDGEPPWDLTARIPNAVAALLPIPLSQADFSVAAAVFPVGGVALLAAWLWARAAALPTARRRLRAVAASVGLVAVSLAVTNPWGADDRRRFFPVFPDYYFGWLALDVRAGPAGARVAYSGTNLPYYLMGVGLRNEVRYVNVDGHRGWLLHDYHRAAGEGRPSPATSSHPRPGWDRARPDYEAWLSNLRAEGIQLLVVTRANPEEGPHNVAGPTGFPVERAWADAHPETFETLYGEAEGDPLFRLYRVRPEAAG